jgi:hypothetical protein
VDVVAEKTSDTRGKIAEKAKEVGRKTGDEMIEQGQKLKNASSSQSAGE